MKALTFAHLPTAPAPKLSEAAIRAPRNQTEDLIAQIVAQCVCTPVQAKTLAKLLAITANTAGWGTSELHALLKKRNDPTIRNYTAYVWWSAKVRKSDITN
jgi:hypothetical protein